MITTALALLLLAATVVICGLKMQLNKSAGLLARANELNERLAVESIRQAISNKL